MKIINDNGKKVDKLLVKGLDTVRSSFPIAMRTMLSKLLEDILMSVPKTELDKFIINFKDSMKLMDFNKIAIPIGVKGIGKYHKPDGVVFQSHHLGTPVHVKSSIYYNDFLKHFNISKQYSKITNGDKIKWVYLKQNPLNIDTIAYKGYEDPPEVLTFIRTYIDATKLYDKALHKKIMMLYGALGWTKPTDASKTLERFF
jgi:hypothetical protein